MAFTNFQQVQEAINLINASLSSSVWHRDNIDIDTDNPEHFKNAFAVKDNNGTLEFYISTNKTGTWSWQKVSAGGLNSGSYIIVNTVDELISISNVFDGLTAFVLEKFNEYRYLNGEWVTDLIDLEISGSSTEQIKIGNALSHFVVTIDYAALNQVNNTIETGQIKITNKNDNKIAVVSEFDEVGLVFEKVNVNDEIYLNISNSSSSSTTFKGKLKWFFI